MFRRMIPLGVAIVLVIGCGKKNPTDAGPGPDPGPVGDDPNATYTIKLRPEQQGDKRDVSTSENSTIDFGKDKFTTETKLEYTEHIIEMPAGSTVPTKATRTYRVAKSTDFLTKQMKAYGFEGKTVNIEKKGKDYQFTMDGKDVGFGEKVKLMGEFNDNPNKGTLDILAPKQPVKVGESWTVPAAALKALGGGAAAGKIDEAKSKLTCKLVKAYKQDGKQRGVIEVDFDIVDEAVGPKKEQGSLKITGTLDAVIDGSATDATIKGTAKGKSFLGAFDASVEKSVKPAK